MQKPKSTGSIERSSYGRGAKILSIGIASTGLVTFAYFSFASHLLPKTEYGEITKLWIVMFVVLSVIYRPVEQLLSRTIASRRAQGLDSGHRLLIPAAIQLSFAGIFLVIALLLRDQLQGDLLHGSAALYWILVIGVLAYAASYFARGWLAGHQLFGLYGGLVLLESCSRFGFVLAAAFGITHGQTAVALGITAAPFASLLVVPLAFKRQAAASAVEHPFEGVDPAALDAAAQGPAAEGVEEAAHELSLKRSGIFAAAVFTVMLAEQALINGGPFIIDASAADAALAGMIFNLLLISRAPLQLFQSVQTSLLPHLAGLSSQEDRAEMSRAIRTTVLAIVGFAAVISLGLLAVGPFAMNLLFGNGDHYERLTLVLVGCGMGMHLIAGTLNQAALARNQALAAAAAWFISACAFILWVLPSELVHDPALRVTSGYLVATSALTVLLMIIYRKREFPAVTKAESHSS